MDPGQPEDDSSEQPQQSSDTPSEPQVSVEVPPIQPSAVLPPSAIVPTEGSTTTLESVGEWKCLTYLTISLYLESAQPPPIVSPPLRPRAPAPNSSSDSLPDTRLGPHLIRDLGENVVASQQGRIMPSSIDSPPNSPSGSRPSATRRDTQLAKIGKELKIEDSSSESVAMVGAGVQSSSSRRPRKSHISDPVSDSLVSSGDASGEQEGASSMADVTSVPKGLELRRSNRAGIVKQKKAEREKERQKKEKEEKEKKERQKQERQRKKEQSRQEDDPPSAQRPARSKGTPGKRSRESTELSESNGKSGSKSQGKQPSKRGRKS
ncbi:hypothetical protein BDW59DRAFT_158317 [Aspergillus cavernicola]|uniref:BZIP domain-containing protein n=1 Tax=Aspergillus cavernicola TaxID=176166 RepID=A0ABR4ITE7_9EURO